MVVKRKPDGRNEHVAPAPDPSDPAVQARLADRARKDPVWWCKRFLNLKLWSAQQAVVESVRDHRETSVRSCNGAGKTYTAAAVVLWFLSVHPGSLVVTTAPTDRQVRGQLWAEIRRMHANARVRLGGRLLTQELHYDAPGVEKWFAVGFTAPDYDPSRFQGWHAPYVLVVVDEGAGVTREIYEAVSALLTGGHSRLLIIGNPTDPDGEFARSFKRPDVRKIKISAFDTPNFTEPGITLEDLKSGAWAAKLAKTGLPHPNTLVTPEWAAGQLKRWGEDSPYFLSRVLADFPETGPDTLIPLAWVEAAQRRSLEPSRPLTLGVDVARFGNNRTSVYVRHGPVVRRYGSYHGLDGQMICGIVERAYRETGAEWIYVDELGLGGAGVVDPLNARDLPVAGFVASAPARESELFVNRRAEVYWGLRERFQRGDIDLDPEDEELAAQLSSIEYGYVGGRIKIRDKDELRKKATRAWGGSTSPDEADAVAIAYSDEALEYRADELGAGRPLEAEVAAAQSASPWLTDRAGAPWLTGDEERAESLGPARASTGPWLTER